MKKLNKYRNKSYQGLFETEITFQELSNAGNYLERLDQVFDFEMFRPVIEEKLFVSERKSNAGRRPIDSVLMFKTLFLQRINNLSDHETRYMILDRFSFRKFLGIESAVDVPDEKTIWAWRERLTKAGVYEKLFEMFTEFMKSHSIEFNSGNIVDASFVEAPRQRNNREENKKIKEGKGEELFEDNPHKKCHKDVDARWAKKGDEKHFGYKTSAKVDEKNKLVVTFCTVPANVHDSKALEPVLDASDEGKDIHLDAGYEGTEDIVRKFGANPVINEKAHRNHPLTEEQKKSNRIKSSVRCRVEHVFGFMEQTMRGLTVRTVGLMRASANVALTCLIYNICRYEQLVRI